MTAYPLCNNQLDSEYLDSVMDELARYKDFPFYSKAKQWSHFQQDLLLKKLALSYYLIVETKTFLLTDDGQKNWVRNKGAVAPIFIHDFAT